MPTATGDPVKPQLKILQLSLASIFRPQTFRAKKKKKKKDDIIHSYNVGETEEKNGSSEYVSQRNSNWLSSKTLLIFAAGYQSPHLAAREGHL